MKATILIVGEDQVLSHTRALLLRDWDVATARPMEASTALRARAYDLLIFCQTVRDPSAEQLLAEATKLYPKVKSLAISDEENRRRGFSSATYMSRMNNPGALRDAVANLLQSAPTDAR